VLDDPLAHAERQIQAAMCGVTELKVFDNAERMKIMVKPSSMPAQTLVERPLTGMTKRRMSDVVDQRQSLRQVFIQSKLRSAGARNLRHFDGMGQAAAKVIGGPDVEYLVFTGKPAKGPR
jgi:hypothetical protein